MFPVLSSEDKSILGVIRKVILFYAIPIPKFTEEDYKAAEREANVKPVSKKQQKKQVRSLHRIDEEDDEESASEPAAKNESGKRELKEGVSPADAPRLKEDENRHKKDNETEKNAENDQK